MEKFQGSMFSHHECLDLEMFLEVEEPTNTRKSLVEDHLTDGEGSKVPDKIGLDETHAGTSVLTRMIYTAELKPEQVLGLFTCVISNTARQCTTVGIALSETLHLHGLSKPNFLVGCSVLSSHQPAGIAGFGRGLSSLPSQLGLVEDKSSFSLYYYLGLRRITIGGHHVKMPYKYLSPGEDGNGGVIIDSTTTFTFIAREAFEPLSDEFIRQIT
ncbi:hypothetical protein OIU77_008168 [Salix suchowensis]|uniref:Xylanase inhibitor C-terminal domain-containing protein n=1 Tax=Salix suchowensis TaxID=1278906 RepID=A0ABQ9AKW8_9ROSI|nr:hypothetical protein OIU77_008168 [Salix suchowensis]